MGDRGVYMSKIALLNVKFDLHTLNDHKTSKYTTSKYTSYTTLHPSYVKTVFLLVYIRLNETVFKALS